MAQYLSEHPDVFVARKELHYFGSDIALAGTRLSWDEYSHFFRQARGERYLCDASVGYLQSERAAREIHECSPAAKILIMLRNPVDWMYSYHSNLLRAGRETIQDFAAALDAEPSRRVGENMPPNTPSPRQLLYRENACFSHQVSRYLDLFSTNLISVIVFEEFIAATRQEYLKTLQFLDLADDGRLSFPVVNSGDRRLRYASVSNFIRYPPPAARKLVRLALPARKLRVTAGGKLARRVLDMNMIPAKREPMDSQLRSRLQEEFADEQAKLEVLLGRTLPWGAGTRTADNIDDGRASPG
jgi:hypothetical protein